jgi:quercetin dioxygenase-like cupin family protein
MFVINRTPTEYDFGGSRAKLLVSGEHSDGAYCMLEFFSPAGRATPTHRHQHEDETVLMLNGELDVNIEGTPHRLRPGDAVLLRRGTTHQLVNRSDHTAHYLVICAPAGFDRFVDACADVLSGPLDPQPPSEAAKARMRAAAPQFGITLLPPPANV